MLARVGVADAAAEVGEAAGQEVGGVDRLCRCEAERGQPGLILERGAVDVGLLHIGVGLDEDGAAFAPVVEAGAGVDGELRRHRGRGVDTDDAKALGVGRLGLRRGVGGGVCRAFRGAVDYVGGRTLRRAVGCDIHRGVGLLLVGATGDQERGEEEEGGAEGAMVQRASVSRRFGARRSAFVTHEDGAAAWSRNGVNTSGAGRRSAAPWSDAACPTLRCISSSDLDAVEEDFDGAGPVAAGVRAELDCGRCRIVVVVPLVARRAG